MNPNIFFIIFLAIITATSFHISSENSRMDRYVADCRAYGGWAVSVRWPDHSRWIQCARLDFISLPEDRGAKP